MGDRGPTHWDLASDAFLKCSTLYEPYEEPVNARLIELAEIAIDQSASMLAVAKTRARDRGLTNIEFRLLDANAFDLPDGTIDAIVCRWGPMFLFDLGDAETVPIISVPRNVMRAFDIPKGPLDPFRLSSAAAPSASAMSAGFDEMAVTRSIRAVRICLC